MCFETTVHHKINTFFIISYLFIVHFPMEIHIFGRNALNCALYLEFNDIIRNNKKISVCLFHKCINIKCDKKNNC